jgi:uncharacterized repeat protein (TIGR01451 family)
VPVLPEALAEQFPQIQTFLGICVDDPGMTARIDLTDHGFHAQILSGSEAIYIDPWSRGNRDTVAVYHHRDHRKEAEDFVCRFAAETSTAFVPKDQPLTDATVTGQSLRTYRLACAATAEYTAFHGGTVSGALSAIVTAINRVNGIYERELGIRMVLVPNNNLLIYSNQGNDPYNNNNGSTMLGQNQSNLDAVIGSANYDIGHVFSTGGGGIAVLGCVCVNGAKAQGVTGSSSPVGDAFWVDYVAHEMGHQFGANHTFNSVTSSCGGGNRNATTAYEPGSGSTIMAYAGICGTDNLQPNSDPYFHSASADEILAYITTGAGASCPVVTSTGNTPPGVGAGPDYMIPRGTPFELAATGFDANGDTLTYCWEERDLGPSTTLTTADNGSSPLFRSFNPTTSPVRTFPRLSWILNGTPSTGETLPNTTRLMTFRVTARDNRSGGGGLSTDDMQVTVVGSAGPFVVTAPNSSVTWSNLQTVTWNVAGTASAPLNAGSVNILLSTNGGQTFPILLAGNTPNDGAETVALPSIASTTARIKVQAAGGIFFDISDSNFTLVPFAPAPQLVLQGQTLTAESCATPNGVADPGEQVTYRFALRNTGNASTTNLIVSLLATNGVEAPSGTVSVGALAPNTSVTNLSFSFAVSGSCGSTIQPTLRLQDGGTTALLSSTLVVGVAVTNTLRATNSTLINIVDNDPASVYPSSILVSGLSGTVRKVTVTLNGFSHGYPDDVDLLLVSPSGQKIMLMSDAGGGNAVDNLTITFDDAGLSLPDALGLTNTTYAPGNFDITTDAFPSPAPPPPYSTLLSSLNQLDPNGAWQLFVWDDERRDSGSITRGWTLTITTVSTTCCSAPAQPDLAISQTLPTERFNPGAIFNYRLQVTNAGPVAATQVTLSNILEGAATTMAITTSQGDWTNWSGNLVVNLGTLPSGGSAWVEVAAWAATAGVLTNRAYIAAAEGDLVVANNASAGLIAINATPLVSTPAVSSSFEDVPITGVLFSVEDEALPPGDLAVWVESLNTNLVPATGLQLSGQNGSRSLTIVPAPDAFGTGTVVIAVSDGLLTNSTRFEVVFTPVNDPPSLGRLPAALRIHAGATASLVVSAEDVDVPKQTLTYSLAPGAPAGGSLNPTDGQFVFLSTDADTGKTNEFTVIVSDGEAANSAVVTVITDARPTLRLTRSNDVTVVWWDSIAGQRYQLQSTENPAASEWIAGEAITGQTETTSVVDTNAATLRFYRLEVLP